MSAKSVVYSILAYYYLSATPLYAVAPEYVFQVTLAGQSHGDLVVLVRNKLPDIEINEIKLQANCNNFLGVAVTREQYFKGENPTIIIVKPLETAKLIIKLPLGTNISTCQVAVTDWGIFGLE